MAEDIVVAGATGFSGRLVVEELVRRGAKPILAGRDLEAVRAFADPLRLRARQLGSVEAFAGAGVVVSCVGPYADTAADLERAACAAGAHLVDLSGEPAHLRASDGSAFAARSLAVVHAAGFNAVLAEALALRLASDLGPLESLEIAVAHAGGAPSLGSLRSYRALARHGQALVRTGGRVVEEPLALRRRVVPFPAPFGARAAASVPSTEVLVLPRVLDVANFVYYSAAAPADELADVERRLTRFDPPQLERAIADAEARGARGPDARARSAASFAFFGEARARNGQTRRGWLLGTDAYGLSARLVAAVALRLRSAGAPGWRTASQVLGTDGLARELADAGVRFEAG